MTCKNPECKGEMKLKKSSKKVACWECPTCELYYGVLISVIEKIREDWWNL